MTQHTCRECKFFLSEPARLERAVPGLNILSSAYGSVRADTALCERHEVFITATYQCPDFLHRVGAD